MQTKMAVQRKTEQPTSTEEKKQEQKNVPKERQNVRTTDLQIMMRIACNDPDSLSREEFLMLQSAIGYRQAMKFIERGKERKEQKKADKKNTSEKDKPVKKNQKKLQIYKPQNLKKQDSELNEDKKTEEKPVQLKKEDDKGNKSELNNNEGTGMPEYLKSGLEALSGVSLSDVNVHRNSDKPQQVGALAYTQGNNIHIASGQDKHLPHEGWHAVQQKQKRVEPTLQMKSGILLNDNNGLEREADIKGEKAEEIGKKMYMAGAGDNIPRDGKITNGSGNSNPVIQKKDDSSQSKPKVTESELEEIQLKGMTNFKATAKIDEYLKENTSGAKINVKYGQFASGTVKITKSGESYQMLPQAISLSRYPFSAQGDIMKSLQPCLVVSLNNGKLDGYLSLRDGNGFRKMDYVRSQFIADPTMLGLRGINLDNSLQIVNSINKGYLKFEINNAKVVVGRAFNGTISLSVEPDSGKIGFSGSASVDIKGLANGSLTLGRSAQGNVTALASLALNLTPHFSGGLTVKLDGDSITGMGTVGYKGEKLSGIVLMKLADKNSTGKPGGELKVPSNKNQKAQYVLSGEGDLMFQFTDWLAGTAHAEIDEKGNVTIVGQIVPQKELELFPQKDFQKDLLKLEARAIYGIPVIGNVYVFGNIGLNAFAKIGPAKLYKIAVGGTYSTDPTKCKDFSIQGSLNISAAAGLTLRAEGGAGLEILGHDLKTGVGISATAGIAAYAEATPIIGYRENAKPGQDKKGDFFISGELEIAAQPFFALGGDVFIEVDSPWWSLLPDKKWIWPLVNKTYPLGNTFGVTARVDHVLGSKQPPQIEFGSPPSFSADKFLTDIVSDKAGGKKSEPKGFGKWKEKNSKSAQPPGKGKGAKDAPKSSAKVPSMPSVSPSRKLPGQKKEASPNAKTSDGKTVKQHKDYAVQDYKPGSKYYKKKSGKQSEQQKERVTQLNNGLAELRKLTAKYDENGVSKDKLQKDADAVKNRYKVFKSINVVDGGKDWDFKYEYNPTKTMGGPKKKLTLKQMPKAGKFTKKQKTEPKKKDAGVSETSSNKPVNKVSIQQYPNHTKMLKNAQGKGHSLKGLKKGSGTSEADKNRYNSQKEIRKLQGPPPKGFDYDEFPYASTKQGGAGAHVELVPSAENQAAGRDLGQFYRKYKLKENDEFDVQLV